MTNYLEKNSLSIDQSGIPLTKRSMELLELDEVLMYCKTLSETVCCDESIMEIKIEEDLTVQDLLYGAQDGIDHDMSVFLREMLSKRCQYEVVISEPFLVCSCGSYEDAASNLLEYAKLRQKYLVRMKDPHEYADFMRSCFPNSVFSNECSLELCRIKDFSLHIEEITRCLSLLDEKALPLYKSYQSNLQEAMKQLQADMQRTCSPDPAHKKDLLFEFSYEESSEKTKHKLLN